MSKLRGQLGKLAPNPAQKAVADPAFGTNGMTRKMEAETGMRVAKSIDTLERTKPKKKGK